MRENTKTNRQISESIGEQNEGDFYKGVSMIRNKKIGILTHYYRSNNYGGNLQAYALCRFINEKVPHVSAEQVSYDIYSLQTRKRKRYSLSKVIKKLKIKLTYTINRTIKKEIYIELDKRKKAILKFNQESIPHSIKIYNRLNINECNSEYDIFITGSDQVWHPNVLCPAYLLSFTEKDKVKLSYAASVAKDILTEEEKQIFKEALRDYKAISVRENEAISLLVDISPMEPEWVLDPVLLLTREKWDFVSTERIVEEPYLFCYFLGDDITIRHLAEEYAKKKNLKIVTLPYLLGEYRKCDLDFGDERLYSISPPDFISLIKYADCIFTDSFHAAVFSGIYEREYFVFERAEAKNSSSRIYSLLSLYETEEHFCDTEKKRTLSYLLNIKKIDYSRKLEKLEEMKKKSVRFLEENIGVK